MLITLIPCDKLISKVVCFRCINMDEPFPTYRRFLTSRWQATCENIVAKGEIAQKSAISPFPKCYSTFLVIIPSFVETLGFLPKKSRLLKHCCMWGRIKGLCS